MLPASIVCWRNRTFLRLLPGVMFSACGAGSRALRRPTAGAGARVRPVAQHVYPFCPNLPLRCGRQAATGCPSSRRQVPFFAPPDTCTVLHMHRVGAALALAASLATGCSESDESSEFRDQACELADENPRTAAERAGIGQRARAIAEPVNNERISRESADILQLVLQLPTLAALPKGQTFPVPSTPPDSQARFATSLEDALTSIKEECGRS